MTGKANTAGHAADPDLAPDASPGDDLTDAERYEQQLEYFGGDKDDIDDFDPKGLDDGSTIDPAEIEEVAKRKLEAEKEKEDAEKAAAETDDEDDGESGDDEADTGDVEEPEGDSEEEADDEEDDDEEDESDDDDAEDEDDSKNKKQQGIPKSRFDEVNERRKAAEARVKELESMQQAEQEVEEEVYDFDGKEAQYSELILDGKVKEATALRKEIRAAEFAQFKKEAKQETLETADQRAANNEIQSLSVEAATLYPVLNVDHEDYDPRIAQRTVAYYQGYLASPPEGVNSAADALVLALSDVIEMYDLDTKYGYEEAAEEKPATKKKGKPRSKAKEKTAIAQKEPSPVIKGGEGSKDRGAAVPDIDSLSQEEFEAIPEATLARLRGDIL